MVVGVIVGVSVGVFDGIGVLVGVAVFVGTSVLLGTSVGLSVAADGTLALGVLVGGSVATVGRFVFVGGTCTALLTGFTPERVTVITAITMHNNIASRLITAASIQMNVLVSHYRTIVAMSIQGQAKRANNTAL